jgi:hypothetical protein
VVVTLVVASAVLVGACSDDDSATSTPSTTIATTATTTTTAAPTTTATTTTTTGGGSSSSVRVEGPTLVGSSPVECNAPTMIELRWEVSGATTIEMRVDGEMLASYPNGARTELMPLPCDGTEHTYTLIATAGGSTSRQSISVQSRRVA